MSTNAIPVSAGSAPRSWLKASKPPADAPIPTIGNDGAGLVLTTSRGARVFFTRALLAMMASRRFLRIADLSAGAEERVSRERCTRVARASFLRRNAFGQPPKELSL